MEKDPKLANAAQTSFARQALDQNYIGILKTTNNEAKTRRNTKSDILKKPGKNGEGRVSDVIGLDLNLGLLELQPKHGLAGKAKRGRPKATTQSDEGQAETKRGRKRKNAAAEEGDAEKQGADMLEPPGKVARISETLIDPTLESGKAPVITMQTKVVWERKVKYNNL
ncbi:hypothetical protein GMOD_00002426 [Pyrenophora seminiperda CCB06]|uniref:Uncharacterized protein n=1 Tax=Pyrenophora seminiperda CCB06 TaxID=1302712 RepID=A0A3M7LXS8_9PLEO|nr:hypothetical protein GMOD_00002426 [Pyrenophora seminiperda CCB06]